MANRQTYSSTFASKFNDIRMIPSKVMAHREQAKQIIVNMLERKSDAEEIALNTFRKTAKEDIDFIKRVFEKPPPPQSPY